MACVRTKSLSTGNTVIIALVAGLLLLGVLGCIIATQWQRILGEMTRLRANSVKRG